MSPTISEHNAHPLSLAKYIVGFLGSITLTLAAYVLVTRGGTGKGLLVGILATLAVVQFMVQMVFFLHVGDERRPRWKLLVMWMMLGVIAILVGGSIWIMNNLNSRMMDSPKQVQQYLKSQDDL
ncbi:MAG TPA: cytochrome o ubiquinol oxidase subunit IV [Candidatus Saccharimonadia bacterium]|nr:cytochrome o ubiquinol oxidase subunit IV [Candidatus Saccharimonadia bacterium]